MDTRVQELCERLKRGSYRAHRFDEWRYRRDLARQERGRSESDGEDRLLQRAVARILEAVFEADFLECSYGFGRDVIHIVPTGATQDHRHEEGWTLTRPTSAAT